MIREIERGLLSRFGVELWAFFRLGEARLIRARRGGLAGA